MHFKEVITNMKFFNLINKSKDIAELYIYGEIIGGDKWEADDVTIAEFKDQLENLDDSVKTLNMYVNSPGGNVFITIAMLSQIERLKERNITVDAYVDGVAASAASFLIMKADNIHMYESSLLMIHKPMVGLLFGANAKKLRDKAEWLDKVEQSTCVPVYMKKAKDSLTADKLDEMLAEETWLSSSEAAQYFDIHVIEETKDAVASLDVESFEQFKNVPQSLLDQVKQKQQHTGPSKEEMEWRNRIAEEAKSNLAYVKTILEEMI